MTQSNIVTTVNGTTTIMENATFNEYCQLIKMLEGRQIDIQPIFESVVEPQGEKSPKSKFTKRVKKVDWENYQCEPRQDYQVTSDNFNLDKALGLPCIYWSIDAITDLDKSSIQVLVRKSIITFFVLNNNKPATNKEIIAFVISEGLSTVKGVNTYRNHLTKMGVLAKDTGGKETYHLSKWFLKQV